jgi:hypothetical protein
MLHWVHREINNTNIVTINQGGATNQRVKFPQELAEPCGLSNGISDGPILSFDTRARDGRLPLRGPGDQIVPEKYAIARGRSVSVRTTSPINIRVSNKILNRGAM